MATLISTVDFYLHWLFDFGYDERVEIYPYSLTRLQVEGVEPWASFATKGIHSLSRSNSDCRKSGIHSSKIDHARSVT